MQLPYGHVQQRQTLQTFPVRDRSLSGRAKIHMSGLQANRNWERARRTDGRVFIVCRAARKEEAGADEGSDRIILVSDKRVEWECESAWLTEGHPQEGNWDQIHLRVLLSLRTPFQYNCNIAGQNIEQAWEITHYEVHQIIPQKVNKLLLRLEFTFFEHINYLVLK